MIFPSIYVFILFSIPTLYAEEDYDDYDSDYEICDFEYIRNCSSYTTGLTNLTEQSVSLGLDDATEPDYEVDGGKEFLLDCCFYSKPYCPNITWYKDGKEIKGNELTIRKMNGGWTLKIFATAESGGDYRCTATTPYGESLSHPIHVSVFAPCSGNYTVITTPRQGVIKVPKGSQQKLVWNFICFGKLHTAAVTCKRNNSIEITENDYYNITTLRSDKPNNHAPLIHTITILNVSRSENITCKTDDVYSPTSTIVLVMEEQEALIAPQTDFFKEKGVWMVIGISLLLSFVVVFVLSLWYRRKVRQKTKIFYNHREKEVAVRYDAFISYSEVDGGLFVRSTLKPMLEDECGYTLSLHYREFSPGAAIVDNIIQGIYDSRRIVVVVTPKFLKSEWCKFEVNQGLRRAVKKPNTLIVIMLNEMPLDVLPKSLRAFLSDVTFLLWDDGKRDEMCKKMKRALGTPFTVNNVEGQNENEVGVEISTEEPGNGMALSMKSSSDNGAVNAV